MYLRLKSDLDGGVTVYAADEAGHPKAAGNLFTFLPNGQVIRHGGVSRNLGFSLDDRSRIIIVD